MPEYTDKSSVRKHFGRICVSLAMLSTLAGLGFIELFVSAPPCHAYSEASSEAGSEAPGILRRRRGRYRRNYQQRQNLQVRQERMREAKERAQQQRQQHQSMKSGPQIRSYGANRRHGRGAGFGNQNQNQNQNQSQNQGTQGAQNQIKQP